MNGRGQALIETAVFMLILSGLIVGLAVFTQWVQIRQKILLATRQGVLLYSSGRFARADVERHIRRYLAGSPPRIDPAGIDIRIGPADQIGSLYFQLDRVSVSYRPPRGWHRFLGNPGVVQETCVVRHAPSFGPPIPKLFGPEVGWGQ